MVDDLWTFLALSGAFRRADFDFGLFHMQPNGAGSTFSLKSGKFLRCIDLAI
jgi:hypothetical protein